MNREIDRPELGRLVAEKTGMDPQTVDTFIRQMFVEVETQISDQALVRLNKLGLFRIIKSGSTKRILFLGTSKKESAPLKTPVKPLLSPTTSGTKNSFPKINIEENKPSAVLAVNQPIAPVADIAGETTAKKQQSDTSNNDDTPANKTNVAEEGLLPETETEAPADKSETFRRPVYQRDWKDDDMAQHDEPYPRKKIPLKYKVIMGAALVIALIVALLTFFMRPEKDYTYQAGTSTNASFKFVETENDDTKNISCAIVLDRDVSVRQLAVMYYGDERFWPYLFKANENIITDGYIIPSQSIVKIPKVIIDLVELNTGQLDDKLNSLAEDIALKALRK